MNLTAYEAGIKSPAAHFPAEGKLNQARRRPTKVPAGISPGERARRQQLAARARRHFSSNGEMSRAVDTNSGTLCKWLNGSRPVPERFVPALERIARTGS